MIFKSWLRSTYGNRSSGPVHAFIAAESLTSYLLCFWSLRMKTVTLADYQSTTSAVSMSLVAAVLIWATAVELIGEVRSLAMKSTRSSG